MTSHNPKTIAVFVMSLDGCIKKGEEISRFWASKEDQKYYLDLLQQTQIMILSRKVYEEDTHIATAGKLCAVLTRSPEKYKDHVIPNELEFTAEPLEDLVDRLKGRGSDVLCLFGANLVTQFLQKKLLDEIWISLEPKIFGSGLHLIMDLPLDIHLQQIEANSINKQGTLLIKYKVGK